MARDQSSVQASLEERQVAPVPLRVAASIVYFQIHRQTSLEHSDAELDRALDDAALALAQIADVYYEDKHGRKLRVPDAELRIGLFGEGAKVFKSASGNEYRTLFMRRIDVMHALEVLRSACLSSDRGNPPRRRREDASRDSSEAESPSNRGSG